MSFFLRNICFTKQSNELIESSDSIEMDTEFAFHWLNNRRLQSEQFIEDSFELDQ